MSPRLEPPSSGPTWATIVVALALAWFAARLIYFALTVHPAVPPDETTHFGLSVHYSRSVGLPGDSVASYELGLVTGRPYLYYLVMGKLLPLNRFGIDDLTFLRLWNGLLALLTVVFGYRWIRLVSDRRLVHVLFTVIVTNVLMFTFLSATVNYDNLVNLLAAMSLFYLYSFFAERRPQALAACCACVLAGCLTKLSFLPLAVILGLVLALHERRGLTVSPAALLAWLRAPGWRPRALQALVLLLVALNMALYGGNLLRHGKPVPAADDVLTFEQAMRNRIFARNYIVGQYRDGEWSLEEAWSRAESIRHAGDRAGTRAVLRTVKAKREGRLVVKSRLAYAPAWIDRAAQTAFGIMGHRSLNKSGRDHWPYLGILAAAAILFAIHWRPGRDPGLTGYAAAIALAYALVLMQLVNYRSYSASGMLVLALQGRYLFPVLLPVGGLIACYLMRLPRPWLRAAVALIVGAFFVYGDLPYFLAHATREWFVNRGP